MSLDPDRVDAVAFDSYSTLVDVDSVEKALEELTDEPGPVSRLWRTRSLAYTMVANHVDRYRPFYELNRLAMRYALAAHGVDLDEEEQEELLSVYHRLDVFPDVREALARLRDEGRRLYVLSNGNPEMLATMVERAGIGDLLEDTVSAHEIETFKPARALYVHGAERAGTSPERMVHVSAAAFDVQGAMHAGMQGVWIDRKGLPRDEFAPEPDLVVRTLHEVAEALLPS